MLALALLLLFLLPMMAVTATFKGLEVAAKEPEFGEAVAADMSFEDKTINLPYHIFRSLN